MRRLAAILAMVLFASIASVVYAQAPPPWSFRNNFAIPDSPAYLLLGVEPVDILRPETPRDLGLGLAKFQSAGGDFVLPRAIAIEVSPLLLTAPDELSLSEYKKHKLWYASRISLATLRDSVSGNATRMAAGFRLTVKDERTVGTDESYSAALQVTDLTRAELEIRAAALERARRVAFAAIDQKAEDDPAFDHAAVVAARRAWNQENGEKPHALSHEEALEMERLAKEIRRRFTERNWNATVWDVAAGLRGDAADSTGRGLQLNAFAFWASMAVRAGSSSQVLFACKVASERDSLGGGMSARGSLGGRYYLGNARAKGFAEFELSMAELQRARSVLNAGLEASVSDWGWVNFSVGRSQSGGSPAELVSSFKLKACLPGL